MPLAYYSYPDASVFKAIFEALSKIVDEVNVEVNTDGIIIRAMDPAQIAYIQVEMPSSSFVQFQVEEVGDYGLIVSSVNKALKRVKRGYKIDTNVRGDEIELSILGGVKRTYIFRAITVPKPELNIEALTFKNKVVVLVEPMKEVLKDIELVSDRAIIEQERSEVLKIRGGGETKYTLSLTRSSGAVLDMVGEGRASSSYNVDYLVNILPLLRLSDVVTLEFNDNGPSKLTVDIPTGGKVTFILAPYLG